MRNVMSLDMVIFLRIVLGLDSKGNLASDSRAVKPKAGFVWPPCFYPLVGFTCWYRFIVVPAGCIGIGCRHLSFSHFDQQYVVASVLLPLECVFHSVTSWIA